jgi:hypothetical protein
MRSVLAVALVGTMAAVGGVVSDAHACGFFNYHPQVVVPQKVLPKKAPVPVAKAVAPKPAPVPASERIAVADQSLDDEHLSNAAAAVLAAFPKIKTMQVASSPLETRAECILALAIVRSNGSLAGVDGFSSAKAADRNTNIDWAISTLRQVEASRPNDPVAEANLGEALASRTGTEDEAVAILGNLANRDLMGSAHAYAALARLRASRGESFASSDATRRCESMTKAPEAVCHGASATASRDARLAIRG